jgi:hypothetical protein
VKIESNRPGYDYLLAVKENQPSLAGALREFFDEGETSGYGRLPVSRRETIEKEHGRIETRRALWISDLSWMDAPLRERWPKLSGVGLLEFALALLRRDETYPKRSLRSRRKTADRIPHDRAFLLGLLP